MTNINCSEKCMYQQEGKCMLDSVEAGVSDNKEKDGVSSCIYFTKPDGLTGPNSTVM